MRSFSSLASTFLLVVAVTNGGCGSSSGGGSGGSGGNATGGSGGNATGGSGGSATGGSGGNATGGSGGGSGGSAPDAAAGGSGGGGAGGAGGAQGGTGGSQRDGGGGMGGGSGGAGGSGGTGGRDASPPPGDTGGSSADTWESFAKAFMATYCASCHNDDNRGVAARDYRMLANVVREKTAIACGTAKSMTDWSARGCTGSPPARQFPVGTGAKPTDAERDRLLKWIDAGTP